MGEGRRSTDQWCNMIGIFSTFILGASVLASARGDGGSSPLPRVGDRIGPKDYPAYPTLWLYHVTTRDRMASIRDQGLVPGAGEQWEAPQTKRHCLGRVFFSAEAEKWWSNFASDQVLLRVPVSGVHCEYDGGEWIDYPDNYEGPTRLADGFTTEVVSPDLIEVQFSDGSWEPVLSNRVDWPRVQVKLELLCADDFGSSYRPRGKWTQIDREHHENYLETRERLFRVQNEVLRGVIARVIDTDDRDSRHTDGYLDFVLGDVDRVFSFLEGIGLDGDILDVPDDLPEQMAKEIEEKTFWRVEFSLAAVGGA